MAIRMARVKDGIVTNVEWYANDAQSTDSLVFLDGRPAGIGDTYDGSDFYRNGKKVVTVEERLQNENADMRAALELLGVKVDE